VGDAAQEVSKAKERSSFLKKRSKRLLFLRQRKHIGHGRDLGSGGEEKKSILAFQPKP
jgi:hypothetical protein